ncbi:MAG: flavin monoamine oxidase family protein [Acidimicrobiia bacterium]
MTARARPPRRDEEPRAPVTAFGPDFPFSFDSWLRHPDGLGVLPRDALGTEVAIIGAGMAGLTAAYELLKLGLRPVLYESRRIGGRLRSEPFASADGVVAELGGMRFPVSSTCFYHYLDLLGLQTRPFPNPLTAAAPTTVIDLAGEPLFAETIDDLPPLFREVAAAWAQALEDEVGLAGLQDAIRRRDAADVQRRWNELVPVWDDRTFYDFVATTDAFARLGFRHREVFGQVGFGTGGWDSDFPNSMLEILRVVVCELESHQRLVVGGAEQVPRGLWRHVPDRLVHHPPGTSLERLHAGATRPGVAAVRRVGHDAIEVIDRRGVARTYPVVLFTTQSWLLTTGIDVEEDLFSQSVWMALDRTRYLQSSKTFVMVDRPFWLERDPVTGRPPLSMTLTDRNTRGTYLFDNGPDQPAVICLSYAWAGDASKVLPLSAEERARLALDTLAKIYPGTDLRAHVIGEPITVSWESDPDFLGAFKGALPGHYRYNRRMYAHFVQDGFAPQHRGVFLAGDDVSWTPGWVEGAIQTALNAVWGIVAHLGGTSPASNPGPGDRWAELAPLALPET